MALCISARVLFAPRAVGPPASRSLRDLGEQRTTFLRMLLESLVLAGTFFHGVDRHQLLVPSPLLVDKRQIELRARVLQPLHAVYAMRVYLVRDLMPGRARRIFQFPFEFRIRLNHRTRERHDLRITSLFDAQLACFDLWSKQSGRSAEEIFILGSRARQRSSFARTGF